MRRTGVMGVVAVLLSLAVWGASAAQGPEEGGWQLKEVNERRLESVWSRADVPCVLEDGFCEPDFTLAPEYATAYCVPSTLSTYYCEVSVIGTFRYLELDGVLVEDRRFHLHIPELVSP